MIRKYSEREKSRLKSKVKPRLIQWLPKLPLASFWSRQPPEASSQVRVVARPPPPGDQGRIRGSGRIKSSVMCSGVSSRSWRAAHQSATKFWNLSLSSTWRSNKSINGSGTPRRRLLKMSSMLRRWAKTSTSCSMRRAVRPSSSGVSTGNAKASKVWTEMEHL